ncbi:Cytochrome b5-like heme/steroid binding protein [Glarea lozoyensis ATCC 20868]|uniref:Cytochrome b5-like heme/steroid binding protein n=1 Tax=Glarea lozoyensis (strain ATCC 20868 / MF5171) TaxID=1116229 RepID=S3D3Y8_GLAL2|nr:Cytochrome b5-like heme/steroid binding protein [Glarea lozoyensis ATCC 20868]EPE31824.1 Cytochrome b5-like heme/steroid binding protein [Glarea lozoyensis ATCC 20868]
MFIGLGLLIASFSFICYKHPPWSLLAWFRHHSPPSLAGAKSKHDAPPSKTEDTPSITTTVPTETLSESTKEASVKISKQNEVDKDRKAMPPPPPPTFKKPSSPTTPKASSFPSNPSSIPSFNLGDSTADDDEDPYASMPPPQFPALNSAQRAGAPRAPPTLQPTPSAGLMAPPSRTTGLMAPPRGPLPNRGPPTSTSSLALPPTHSAPPTKPKRKVQLTPGHSPLDWARLASSPTANLRGLPPSTPYLKIAPSQLKVMTGRKGKDAWTVLGGRVYNITPYAAFHPGGVPELMRSAGKDGTRMFAEVHPWVNWEGMLEGCLVGTAVEEGEGTGQGVVVGEGMEDMD